MFTIIESKEKIFSYLIENDFIHLNKDIDKLVSKKKDKDIQAASLTIALNELVSSGVLSSLDGNLFVLNKPLNQYSQTVELSSFLISDLISLVNEFCKNMGDNSSFVDPFNVTEKDINSAILIAKLLLKAGDNEE